MSDLLSIPALDETELETLGQYLEDQLDHQESFDFFETHGFLTALKVGPVKVEWEEVYHSIFPEYPNMNQAELEDIKRLIRKLSYEIQAWLDSGQDFPVPCDLTLQIDDNEEESAMEAWAAGFMAAVLHNEDAWYARNEDQVAEYLFPIMYASGLFAEEPDMAEIDEDDQLSDQMCSNIPPAIIELFLHYHAAKG